MSSFLFWACVFVTPALAEPASASCPCYFAMLLSPNGLGNRVAETASGMAMADELGCHYLFDRAGFVRGSVHGAYDEALQFLNIDAGVPLFENVISRIVNEVVVEVWPWPRMANESQCGTLFRAKHTQICQFKANRYATWCTKTADFNLVKWSTGMLLEFRSLTRCCCTGLREQFFRVPRPRVLRAGRALTVAWHLRVGDISPDRGNRDFFVNVFGELQRLALAQSLPIDVHFVFNADEDKTANATRLPTDYQFVDEVVCRAGANCVLHGRATVVEALQLMISTDVLVTSRSSFAYIASLYTRGIVLFETPKENCDVCYYVSEAFRVDTSGRIFFIDEFRARTKLFFRTSRFRN